MIFFCVERLCDFSHSLTHSVGMIFFSGGCVIFFWRLRNFFVERSHEFFWRSCMTFFVESLHDFFVERLHNFFGGQVV